MRWFGKYRYGYILTAEHDNVQDCLDERSQIVKEAIKLEKEETHIQRSNAYPKRKKTVTPECDNCMYSVGTWCVSQKHEILSDAQYCDCYKKDERIIRLKGGE